MGQALLLVHRGGSGFNLHGVGFVCLLLSWFRLARQNPFAAFPFPLRRLCPRRLRPRTQPPFLSLGPGSFPTPHVVLHTPASPPTARLPAQPSSMAGAIRRAANWKREEVRDLIALWGEESVQLALRKNHRNQAVYDAIALRMAARGHNRDGQQCRNKAKDLRRHYKQTRDANRRAGTKRATCPFYKELSRILAGNPGGRPRLLPGPGREPEDTDVSGSEEAPCEVAEDPSEGLVLFKTEEHEAVPLLHEGSSDETNLAEFQLPPLPPLPAAADSQPPPGQPAETPPTSDSDDPGE